jgi:hypothetical protein
MPVKLIETSISEAGDTIYMRFADDPNPDEASEWIEYSLPNAEHLIIPSVTGNFPLGPLSARPLATIQLAALLRVQSAIGAEIQRLSGLASPR